MPPHSPPCVAQLELVLVLDKSGSVRSAQSSILDFAREIVSQFALSPTAAQIGVVEFSNDGDTLIGLSGDVTAVQAAIDSASAAGGGTSVSDGLALGLSVIQGTAARAGVPSTILLLTDGVQTVDGNDQTAIAQAAVVKNAGVSIVSVGFGGARTSTSSRSR